MQSFEVGNLMALRSVLRVHLVQLTSATGAPYDFVAAGDPRTYADLTTPAGLREVARYADVLGPDKNQIVPRDADGPLLTPTTLVRDAHRARLAVVPYTFRNENSFLPLDFRRGTDPARTGTRSPSTRCSSRSASTGSSATTPTPPGRPGTSSSGSTGASGPPADRAGAGSAREPPRFLLRSGSDRKAR